MTQRPAHVYEVYIRTTPERLWAAITSPEYTRRYFFGGWYESSWQPGAPYRTLLEDGSTPFEGTLIEVDPPRRLAYTFHHILNEAALKERPSRVSFALEPYGELVKLTLTHEGFAGDSVVHDGISKGWPAILSSLKSLLETGKALDIPIGALFIDELDEVLR